MVVESAPVVCERCHNTVRACSESGWRPRALKGMNEATDAALEGPLSTESSAVSLVTKKVEGEEWKSGA